MSTPEPLTDFAVNTYEVSIPLDITAFDSIEELELTLVEAVATSIVAEVDALDDDDASYITTQVEYDEEILTDVFHDDTVEIATVMTRTQLGVVDE